MLYRKAYARAMRQACQGGTRAMPTNPSASPGATPAPRARRPRGSLTREAVVDAALAVVDAEGVEALSMPRLARQLDAGVMTLYRYVQSKQELLDAVAVRAIAEVPASE